MNYYYAPRRGKQSIS